MALPVVVPVGEDAANRLREKLIPAINAWRIGVSNGPGAHYGPVVTPEHKARVEGWIDTAEAEGAARWTPSGSWCRSPPDQSPCTPCGKTPRGP